MQLSHQQKQEFIKRGFVKVPGVVPHVMVDEALRAINHSLGEGIDPEQVHIFRSRSYAPELQRQPVITDLVNKTPALALAESLIGADKIKPISGGQIALRFPSQADPPPPPHPHLDGMYSPNNGVPKGTIRNFTMLLGVALSEVQAPFAGNFTVWPGTHTLYEKWFRERGPQALLEGMPKVEIPAAEQQMVSPGDIMLVHYQLAHAAAVNVSPHVRYAIYFRLHHVDHEGNGLDTLTNIWLEWDGVRDLIGQVSQPA
ncbi:MAG: phytanoyl-CoA dioxygenase family protein [Caldilineaceae bacterium]|nr:phytanoyl-CoA dioxygenase family protein [Caldilineaceae bacterium]